MRIRRSLVLTVAIGAVVWGIRRRLTRTGSANSAMSAIRRSSMGARNSEIVRLGARVGATYASASARKVFASAERRVAIDHDTEMKTAAHVAERLGNMKGALMKLGQMASYLD
ncbi:MAG: hypothetical protein ACO3SP_07395, partial [Ilumatobacteraceae bacterium]